MVCIFPWYYNRNIWNIIWGGLCGHSLSRCFAPFRPITSGKVTKGTLFLLFTALKLPFCKLTHSWWPQLNRNGQTGSHCRINHLLLQQQVSSGVGIANASVSFCLCFFLYVHLYINTNTPGFPSLSGEMWPLLAFHRRSCCIWGYHGGDAERGGARGLGVSRLPN